MTTLEEIERRHRTWVMAGRPGVYDECELLERLERAEYAVMSFWYAAQAPADSPPHSDALAIAQEIFARGMASRPAARPHQAAEDREALLAALDVGDTPEDFKRRAEERHARRPAPERFGLDAPPPRLLVVSDDPDQPGMCGEGTFP